MSLNKITYSNKVSLNPQPSIANINKCTDSDLNEIKNVVNAGIDTINGNGTMGDIVVDGIRTKNLFDKNTIVEGDIIGNSPTIRLSSRQPIWLEAGTYTFSCNLTSPLRWSLNVQNVATPPLSTYTTYIYDSGWLTYSTTSHTFTINSAGWFCLMLSKENNVALTPEEVKGFNYQLEVGDTATTYKPYQDLNNESDLYLTSEIKIGNYLGKPLYRKVFIISTTNDMNLEYVHGLANLDKYYINNGMSILFGNNESLPVNWYWTSNDYARCWMNSTKLRWRCPANVGNRTLYLVVEYTKTTD